MSRAATVSGLPTSSGAAGARVCRWHVSKKEVAVKLMCSGYCMEECFSVVPLLCRWRIAMHDLGLYTQVNVEHVASLTMTFISLYVLGSKVVTQG